ncbi:MAG: type II toxin-antitoxin system PemK/MazF family toxin [bacterium]
MNYDFGDIVIVPFPFILESGESKQKARPALVITNSTIERRFEDIQLAAITSQVPNELLPLEILLDSTEENGLAKESVLRLDFIMTLPGAIISRKIGTLSSTKRESVRDKLRTGLGSHDE